MDLKINSSQIKFVSSAKFLRLHLGSHLYCQNPTSFLAKKIAQMAGIFRQTPARVHWSISKEKPNEKLEVLVD